MKIVKIKAKSTRKRGSQGSYYKIPRSDLGVKLLHSSGCDTEEACKTSLDMKCAELEAKVLRMVEPCRRTPKHAEAVVVFHDNQYKAGIMMQHMPHERLSGCKRIDDYGYDEIGATADGYLSTHPRRKYRYVHEWIDAWLKPYGITHNDDFYGNILIDESGKLYIIDFGRAVSTDGVINVDLAEDGRADSQDDYEAA
jgi:serine/threonine protein kinase